MDNNNPLVTIITPVYNAEAFIGRCIQSVVAQTYENWELLLIDDGSPDKSGSICDEWSKKDSRIKTFHKNNGGVSSARNLGLEKATGDWVMFVDSDDWVSEDCLAVCLDYAKKNGVDVLQYNMYKVTPNGKYYQESLKCCDVCTLNEYVANRMVVVCVWGGLYTRRVIEDNHIRFDEKMKYAEDGVFVCSTLYHANRMMHIKESLYFYFMNENSAMHKINIDAYLDSMLVQIDFLNKHVAFQPIYRNLVSMNIGRLCSFGLTHAQFNRMKEIWYQYRDDSPYVHVSEYRESRSVERVFLPLQKYSFLLAVFFTALVTKLFWLKKNKYQ